MQVHQLSVRRSRRQLSGIARDRRTRASAPPGQNPANGGDVASYALLHCDNRTPQCRPHHPINLASKKVTNGRDNKADIHRNASERNDAIAR